MEEQAEQEEAWRKWGGKGREEREGKGRGREERGGKGREGGREGECLSV
jgi:hypothetical protein